MIVTRAKELRKIIEQLAQNLEDSESLKNIQLFPEWKIDVDYEVDNKIKYKNILYKCLTSHTSQSTWIPSTSPSLWVRIDNPTEEWPEWIQPLGSTDAYSEGAKVSHNEKHWISNVNNNVWEPGIYGWNQI